MNLIKPDKPISLLLWQIAAAGAAGVRSLLPDGRTWNLLDAGSYAQWHLQQVPLRTLTGLTTEAILYHIP